MLYVSSLRLGTFHKQQKNNNNVVKEEGGKFFHSSFHFLRRAMRRQSARVRTGVECFQSHKMKNHKISKYLIIE